MPELKAIWISLKLVWSPCQARIKKSLLNHI